MYSFMYVNYFSLLFVIACLVIGSQYEYIVITVIVSYTCLEFVSLFLFVSDFFNRELC